MTIVTAKTAGPLLAATNYDVVVYGATWSGINAAMTASLMGMRVALVEPTGYVGGVQAQSGMYIDIQELSQIGGLTWQAVQQFAYVDGVVNANAPTQINKSLTTAGHANTWTTTTGAAYQTPQPKTMETVFKSWIQRSGVDLYLNAPLATTAGSLTGSVIYTGVIQKTITGLHLAIGTITGKAFVDCSYEGDVMAQTCSYMVGRESSSTLSPDVMQGANNPALFGYGETLAGVNTATTSTVSGATFIQSSLPIFPFIANPNETIGNGDSGIAQYNFRCAASLIADGNAIPFYKPAGYLASDYQAVAMFATGDSYTDITNLVEVTRINGSPNKYVLNVGGGAIMNLLLPNASSAYPEATPFQRAQITKAHRVWAQGFLYFIGNDASVPSALRTSVSLYGYSKDEFTTNGNFPRELYRREGRRMIGQYVFRQSDLDTNITKTDTICRACYGTITNFQCNTYPTSATVLAIEGNVNTSYTGAPRYPLRSILPLTRDVTNLVVPVCFSASHIGWAGSRWEMMFSQMGEAAGIVAALSVQTAKAVQSIPYSSVQTQLNNIGANIT